MRRNPHLTPMCHYALQGETIAFARLAEASQIPTDSPFAKAEHRARDVEGGEAGVEAQRATLCHGLHDAVHRALVLQLTRHLAQAVQETATESRY